MFYLRIMRENKDPRTNVESTTRVCNVCMRLGPREERKMEEGKEKGGTRVCKSNIGKTQKAREKRDGSPARCSRGYV